MNEAATQNWSSRALERQIGILYYERLLASQDRAAVEQEAQHMTTASAGPREFVRDPVLLEFPFRYYFMTPLHTKNLTGSPLVVTPEQWLLRTSSLLQVQFFESRF